MNALRTPLLSKYKLKTVNTAHATVRYADASETLVRSFCDRIDISVDAICAYLHVVPPSAIDVRIVDRPRRSAASIAQRLVVVSASNLPHRTAICHELTHILAGSGLDPHGILDEGLPVHVQATLADATDLSFPTEGKALTEQTRSAMIQIGGRIPMTSTTSARIQGDARLRRLAYLQQGSFVRFLISNFGLERAMAVFRGESGWAEAFATSIETLECHWLKSLQIDQMGVRTIRPPTAEADVADRRAIEPAQPAIRRDLD
jgi:hypothetical protein